MIHLHYVYDTPPDSPAAALVQASKTLAAARRRGVAATLYLRHADPPAVEAMRERLGLNNDEMPDVRAFRVGRGLGLRRRLASLARSQPPGRRHVLLTRGEPGLGLIPRTPAGWLSILEVHRLSFARLIEQRTGTAWTSDTPVHRAARRMREREARAWQAAHGRACVSQGVADAATACFGDRPSIVLPSGVDRPDAPPAGDDARPTDLIYTGKLTEGKGVGLCLALLDRLPGVTLELVGGNAGEVAAARREAERLGVADRVAWAGRVSPAESARRVERAKLGLCPIDPGVTAVSRSFTSPMKALEYQARGAVVLASDTPAVREMINDNVTGRLAPAGDVDAWARVVDELLNRPDERQRLRTRAYEACGAFVWDRRAKRLLGYVNELVEAGR